MHQIQPSSFPQPALDVGKGQHTHSVRAGDAVQDEQITAKIQSIVFLLQEARGSTLSSVRTLLAATVTSGPATTTSSIVELIGEHQRQEVSIQQTISEALASISETEGQKSRSNITAEVVLQYTQPGIHRSKIINNIFIYLLFHFFLNPDPEQ